MKLIVKTAVAGYSCRISVDGRDSVKVTSKYDNELPAFKSGDQWIAEVDLNDGEGPHVTVVSVWIDPEEGIIKVTPAHYVRRKSFDIVTRWIIKLELS